jgi:hypothetical protein
MGDADMVEALVALDRGAWKRVGEMADRIDARGRQGRWRLFLPLGPLLVGRARLGAGRVGEAAGLLVTAVNLAREVDASGAHVLARIGLDQAHVLSGRRISVRGTPRRASPEVQAMVEENRALLALRSGDAEEAAEGFHRAIVRWEDLGLTVWLARALAFRADALRAAKRSAQARRMESRAAEVLAAIEAPRGALP